MTRRRPVLIPAVAPVASAEELARWAHQLLDVGLVDPGDHDRLGIADALARLARFGGRASAVRVVPSPQALEAAHAEVRAGEDPPGVLAAIDALIRRVGGPAAARADPRDDTFPGTLASWGCWLARHGPHGRLGYKRRGALNLCWAAGRAIEAALDPAAGMRRRTAASRLAHLIEPLMTACELGVGQVENVGDHQLVGVIQPAVTLGGDGELRSLQWPGTECYRFSDGNAVPESASRSRRRRR